MTNSRLLMILVIATILSCSKSDNEVESKPVNKPGSTEFLKDFANFPIGNIVSASGLASTASDKMNFKNTLLGNFNSITAENDMKMYAVFKGPDNFDFSAGDEIVSYARQNGLRVHGHALLWHPEYAIPDWLENFTGTDAEFENHIKNYVKTTVQHFASEKDANGNSIVVSWDVVNEYFDGAEIRSSLFTQRLGDDYIDKVFQWAREADSNVKLFYNDYNIAGSPAKRQVILNMVQDFKTNNIPIDGIGMQMHLNHDWPNSDLPNAIKKIADTGLLVYISELDVKVNYADDISNFTSARAMAQKQQYQRVSYYYTTLVPSAQQCGITIWGMRDQDSWLYDGGNDWPLIYDESYNRKPSYTGFLNGLKGENPAP